MRKPRPHSPSKKSPKSLPKAKKPSSAPVFPTLEVVFESVEVQHNGWPGNAGTPTDLSLILQLEIPSAAAPSTALASARMPFRAASGQTVAADDLPPDASGRPFFGGPVRVSNHVNLHARLFVDRTNTVGPILGAALNTVIGTFVGQIPLLGSPLREVLHIQIGNVISTELARARGYRPGRRDDEGDPPGHDRARGPALDPGRLRAAGEPGGLPEGKSSSRRATLWPSSASGSR